MVMEWNKWFLTAFTILVALAPSAGWAGPIDIGLEFIGITTQVIGNPTNNFASVNGTPGAIGKSFSGSASSVDSALALTFGLGPYDARSSASSVSWNARFKTNQPDLAIEVVLLFQDYGFARSSGWAYANGNTSVTLSLNGVPQLSDHQGSSCNTSLPILDCGNVSGNENEADITLVFKGDLSVGQIIDISGFLSTDASATAGPFCGTLSTPFSCLALGFGSSNAQFTITATAIPGPPNLLLFGTGFLLIGLVLLGATKTWSAPQCPRQMGV